MSYRYFSSGREYLEALGAGVGESLPPYFRERVAEYNHAYRHDELITVGVFDDLAKLSNESAFKLIPAAVSIALDWRDGSLLDLAVTLLRTLAQASGTTELPEELDRAWPSLSEAVESWLARELVNARDMTLSWDALRSHYRRT